MMEQVALLLLTVLVAVVLDLLEEHCPPVRRLGEWGWRHAIRPARWVERRCGR